MQPLNLGASQSLIEAKELYIGPMASVKHWSSPSLPFPAPFLHTGYCVGERWA